ncbi:N-acetyltransferase [Anaerolineae bacterium CFX9]|nr:N-acetyltransferase [Anaerolineae bacterium CFX9]
MTETLQPRKNDSASRFEIDLGGDLAVINYHLTGNTYLMTHTGVPVAWRGRGIASRLTQFALETARDEGRSVIPACSFIRTYIERNPEFLPLISG